MTNKLNLKVFEEYYTPNEIFINARYEDGDIVVFVCNSDGKALQDGNLFAILEEGTLYLHPCINPAFGFPLDEKGRLIIQS